MNNMVDTCALTKSEGGLNLLYEADDDTVNVNVEFKVTLHEQVHYRGTLQYKHYNLEWLESTATAALAM